MDHEKMKLTVLTALGAAQVLHETLDELTETTFYRHSLKAAIKKFQLELTKTCDSQLTTLWGIDEEVMRMIEDGISETSKLIAKADPSDIAAFGSLLSDGLEISDIILNETSKEKN